MNSWPAVALGDVFTIARGGSPRPIDAFITDDPGGINWIMIGDAVDGSKYIESTRKKIRPEGVSRSREVKAGDFLLTNSMSFGHPYILKTSGCIHDGWLVLSPRDGNVDADYFYHLLGSPFVYAEFARLAAGAVVKNLNSELVRGVKVPVPPLAEQRRIAGILDKADAIRRKRKESIALIEELLRSTFLEMFGDPVSNPMGWPTESIEALCSRGAELVDGPFGSSLKPEHYVASGVKVVRNWNIYDDRFDTAEFKYVTPAKFDEIRRSEVRPGDVLITTKGTVGDVCVAPDLGGPAVLSASGTVRLRVPPDESYLPEFIVGQMTMRTYKNYLHTFEAGSAQQYLNLSAVRKMRLIRPPKKAQIAFRSFRSRLRESQCALGDANEGAEELFNSLVARAFSGSLETATC